MRKPDFCICENKDADQLRGNCEADQRLCFRYSDSMIFLLSKSKISRLQPSSAVVQPGLCRTGRKSRSPVFSERGSILMILQDCYYLFLFVDSVTKAVSDADRKRIEKLEEVELNLKHEISKLKVLYKL